MHNVNKFQSKSPADLVYALRKFIKVGISFLISRILSHAGQSGTAGHIWPADREMPGSALGHPVAYF